MSLLPNTVVNGNCLEVMKEIDDASIDMILCDLPYGATQNSWDSVIPPAPLWEQYERIIKPNGAILLFGQDKFTATMMLSNPKLHRYNIIWDKVLKSGFLNAKKMPLREHEDIMVFYKSPPPYHPQMTVGEKNHTKGKAVGKQAEDVHSNRSYGNYTLVESPDGNMKYPASIWRFPKPHPSVALHATEKPVDLLRYAIRTYTDRDAIVLDNCCGTGSTLIAAKLEGRRYIGIDNGVCDKKKSPYYGMPWAQVAQIRLEAIDHEPADEPERHRPLGEGTTEGVCTPSGVLPEIGEVVNILEPFKRLTIFEPVEKDGETTEKKVTVGIIYRSDGLYAWDNSRAVPNEYDEAIKWSPASQLPEYAIRRKAIVTKFEYKPLRSFTADDIKLLRLDYASQDDPQLLMEEYLPIKNFELLYGWWKQHYKATLKDCDNPQAIILHLASTD